MRAPSFAAAVAVDTVVLGTMSAACLTQSTAATVAAVAVCAASVGIAGAHVIDRLFGAGRFAARLESMHRAFRRDRPSFAFYDGATDGVFLLLLGAMGTTVVPMGLAAVSIGVYLLHKVYTYST